MSVILINASISYGPLWYYPSYIRYYPVSFEFATYHITAQKKYRRFGGLKYRMCNLHSVRKILSVPMIALLILCHFGVSWWWIFNGKGKFWSWWQNVDGDLAYIQDVNGKSKSMVTWSTNFVTSIWNVTFQRSNLRQ